MLFFSTESISKVYKYYFNVDLEIQKFTKLIVLCYLVFSLFKAKDIKAKYLIFAVFSSFILGQLFTKSPFEFSIIVFFLKYIFPLLLLFYFKEKPLHQKHKNKLFKIFEKVIAFNTIFVFLGFIFSISFFKTYNGDRFGYNGFLVNSSTSSYIYVISLFYFLNAYKQKLFFKPIGVFILIGSLLIGTKTIYFSLFIIILYYLIVFTKKKQEIVLVSIGLIALIIFGYLSFFQFGIFNRIRVSDGFLTTFLSYRNYSFINDTLPYIQMNWGAVNYLFGGVNDFSLKSEMGFIDLIFFFGILGAIIYIYSYLKAFLNFKIEKIPALFLLVLISIIFIAGNFFTYSNVVIYLLIIRESFCVKTEFNDLQPI